MQTEFFSAALPVQLASRYIHAIFVEKILLPSQWLESYKHTVIIISFFPVDVIDEFIAAHRLYRSVHL